MTSAGADGAAQPSESPRARTEPAALRESEKKFSALFAASPAPFLILEPDAPRFTIAEVNEAYLAATMRTREEVVGRGVFEAFPDNPDDAAIAGVSTLRASLERVLASHQPDTLPGLKYDVARPDGTFEERWWSPVNSAVLDEHGEVVAIIHNANDVTEQHRTEAALRESEERLRLALAAGEMGTWLWRIESDEQILDDSLARLMGRGAAEEVTSLEHFLATVVEEDRPRVREAIAGSAQRGSDMDVEFRVVWPDGSLHWLKDQGKYFGGDGHPAFMAGACVDITERKAMEQTLREADRRKDEYLAMLAHELRNPLAPIANALHILRTTGGQGEAAPTAISMMERQVEHVVRLVDDLLDVSRISRGNIELRREPVELAAVIRDAADAARPLYESRELSLALPARPVYVDADFTRLVQVVSNLLQNAAKFTHTDGRVWLTLEKAPGGERRRPEALIRVRDNGVGLAADDRKRIFEIFTQVDASRQRSRGGLGIGLSLVKNLVELHGGTVEVHSAGLRRGSEFVVCLPLAADQPSRPVAPTPATAGGEKADGASHRILVVDDNRMAADSMAMLLELAGHEVHARYGGAEAISAAEELAPELVVLDIGMPDLDGYEVCRRIRQQSWGREIAVAALTGWGQDEDRRRTEAAGFDAHLVKPVAHKKLKELIATLLSDDDVL